MVPPHRLEGEQVKAVLEPARDSQGLHLVIPSQQSWNPFLPAVTSMVLFLLFPGDWEMKVSGQFDLLDDVSHTSCHLYKFT